MSDVRDVPIERTSTVSDTADRYVPATIKAREDVDGCGCLECRSIDAVTTRRSVLDALVWTGRLFRRYPSIIVLGLAVIALNRLLETDGIGVLPAPVVGGLEVVSAIAFLFVLRAYIGTIVASELSGQHVTRWGALRHSLSRIPTLVGAVLLVLFAVMIVPSLVSMPLFVLFAVVPGNPVEQFGFPLVAAVGGTVFALPFFFLLLKFWFAPEACVIGEYGPLKSLRVSWRITTTHRRKLLLVILLVTSSAVSFYVFRSIPHVAGDLSTLDPILTVLSRSIGDLLSVVWAGAYAHIYVQGILEPG